MRTYGRSFAEFLNEESHVRLRLPDVPTCFGFSTVAGNLILGAFLERWLCEIDSPEGKSFLAPANAIKGSLPVFPGKHLWRKSVEFNNTLRILIFVTPSKLPAANEY